MRATEGRRVMTFTVLSANAPPGRNSEHSESQLTMVEPPRPTNGHRDISVLIWTDPSGAGQVPGGHLVQMSRTADALRKRGLTVVTTGDPDARLDGHDLVHGMSVGPEQVRRVRGAGMPIVLSSIYISR